MIEYFVNFRGYYAIEAENEETACEKFWKIVQEIDSKFKGIDFQEVYDVEVEE